MLEPLKRSGGRRYYRAEDVALVERIDRLVNREGYTLRGAKAAILGVARSVRRRHRLPRRVSMASRHCAAAQEQSATGSSARWRPEAHPAYSAASNLRLAQIDADQPAHALFDHGHAEQAVHPAHRHRIVRDDQIAGCRFRAPSHRAGRRSGRYWRRPAAHRPRRARRSAPGWSGTARRSARSRSAPVRRPIAASAIAAVCRAAARRSRAPPPADRRCRSAPDALARPRTVP